jgi:exodeoxyribonuclease VII small subunit
LNQLRPPVTCGLHSIAAPINGASDRRGPWLDPEVDHHALSKSLADMPPSDSVPASFEAALAELEAIVAAMEGGQLPLKESLVAYKRGAELLQYCQSTLKDAEQQVQVYERGLLKAFESPETDAAGDES